jgi:flagellar basal body-associated protein FliL
MISFSPLIAGLGPFGTAELMVISVLIFVVLAPILLLGGMLYYFFFRKSAAKSKDQAQLPENPNKD